MDIEIRLNLNMVELKLTHGKRIIDSLGFFYYHDLDQKLITYIDRLLKRSRVDLNSIKHCRILESIGKNATSYKITKAFVEGLMIGF